MAVSGLRDLCVFELAFESPTHPSVATADVTPNSLPSLLLSLHKLKASALTAIVLSQLKPRILRHLHRLVAKRSDKFVRRIR